MQILIRKVQVQDHLTTRQLVYKAFKGAEPEETALFLTTCGRIIVFWGSGLRKI